MAATQADLDALEDAINSGALMVRFADRQVTYRSLDDMNRIAAKMRAEITGTSPTRRVKIASRTGFR